MALFTGTLGDTWALRFGVK